MTQQVSATTRRAGFTEGVGGLVGREGVGTSSASASCSIVGVRGRWAAAATTTEAVGWIAAAATTTTAAAASICSREY